MSLEIKFLEKIDDLKETLLELIPEEKGQSPHILLHQVRARKRKSYEINWELMQIAFNELYNERRVYPEQNFSQSIIKRAYKF